MSVSGISSSSFMNSAQSVQSQMQQEFQQLGKDLQSGNLSAAQADFVTLQQSRPQTNSTSSTSSSQSNSPIAQEFNQLSQDLQSGNLSGAQKDYTQIQQDFQKQASSSQAMQGHHHHHGGGESDGGGESGGSGISQLFSQLGQDLQSGNLSSAQQAYTSLQQDFQQFSQGNALNSTPTSSQSSSSGVSVLA
jgi:outer membrane protein assembly factor BamD (BamD/ComL family)